MRPLRILLLFPLGVAILLAAAWLLCSPYLANEIRNRLRDTLTAELGTPVRLDAVELALLPPTLELRGLAVGTDAELLHLRLLRARMLPLRSLRQFIVAGQATVEDLELDVPKVSEILETWASERQATEPRRLLPLIQLEEIQCNRIRVRLSERDAPLDLLIEQLLGELTITGGSRVSHLQLRGTGIELRRSTESLELSEVRLGMADRGRGLILQSLDIEGDGFGVSTPTPSADGKTTLRLDADLTKLGLLGVGLADWQGDLQAHVVIDGPVEDGDVTASVQVQDLAFAGEKLAGLEARLNWQDDTIELQIDQRDASSIRLDASLGEDDALEGRIEVSSELASLPRWYGGPPDLELHGKLGAVGSLGGTLEQPRIKGRAWISPLSLDGFQLDRIEAELSLDRQRLAGDAIEIRWPGGGLSASGASTFGPDGSNDWRAEIRKFPLDQARLLADRISGVDVPVSGGSVDATLVLDGAWPGLAIHGQAQAVSFRLLDEPFERLRIDVTSELPKWSFDAQLTRGAQEALSVVGSGEEGRRVRLTVEGTDWNLQGFGATAGSGIAGLVNLQGTLDGPPGALTGTVVAKGEDLSWNGRSLGDGRLQADAVTGTWQIGADLLQGAVRLDGSVSAARQDRFDFRARWTDVDFAVFLSDDPSLQVQSSGSLDVGGDPGRPLGLGGEMHIESLLLANGEVQASNSDPIRVRGQDGHFTVDPFTLAGVGERIQVFGSFGLDGSFSATADGNGSLQLFEILGGPLRSANGRWEAQLVAQRRPPDGVLVLQGTASVSSAALDFGLPVGPSRTNGRFSLSGTEVIIEELSGRIGGGSFAVGGGVDLQRGPHLTWKFDEVSTGLLSPVEDEVSGHGIVGGSWEDLTIAGDLEILRMLYDQRIEILDFLPSLRPAVAAASPRDLAEVPIRLDLRITAPGEIFLDNNFARIEAKADLEVTGSLHEIGVSGPIDVLTGEVFFRGRTFEVTTGLIEFRRNLGLHPHLNIVAESEIDTSEESYTVTIEVLGTTDDYRVTMSADDGSLSQTDVLSLIAFGKTTAQLQQGGGGRSPGDLLAHVPGRQWAQKGTASLLRLDRVEFEPAFSRTTGRFEPELTVEKQVTEDLSATFGATFGVEGRQTFGLSYSLTPGISLLGTWESESVSQKAAFGGGAQLRRQFRNFPGFSLLGSSEAGDLSGSEEWNEE